MPDPDPKRSRPDPYDFPRPDPGAKRRAAAMPKPKGVADLGISPPRALDDIELELKQDDTPQTFEHGGETITRQNKESYDRSRLAKPKTDWGPTDPAALYNVVPDLETPAEKRNVDTRPCPGCGWPLEVSARVCTKCGYNTVVGAVLTTEVGITKAPAPKADTRFQTYQHDPLRSRGAWIKAIVILLGGLSVALGAQMVEVGTGPGLTYLARYAITLGTVIAMYLVACYFWLEFQGPALLAVIRLAAILAAADAAQQIWDLPILIVEGIWPLALGLGLASAMAMFIGWFSDLCDVELQDSIIFTMLVYLAKFVLWVALFRTVWGVG